MIDIDECKEVLEALKSGFLDIADIEPYMETICKALEKQMPKKPYFREEEGAKGYACPSCDMGVEIRLFQGGCVKERFCSCCGQALDWSGENE